MQASNCTAAAGGRQYGKELAAARGCSLAVSREEVELVDFVLHAGPFRERLARRWLLQQQHQQGGPSHAAAQCQS